MSMREMTAPVLGGEEKQVGDNWLDTWAWPGFEGFSHGRISITPSDECTISLVVRPKGDTDEDHEEELDLNGGDAFPAEVLTEVPVLLHSNYEYNLRITNGDPSEIVTLGFAAMRNE